MSENHGQTTGEEGHVNQITLTAKDHWRFWSKVNKEGPVHTTQPHLGRCWLWTAGVWSRGYGAFGFRGSQIKSHRLSYLTEVGPIPNVTPFVLHSCDVRLCCNPTHLFLGTYADNAADMCSKGRQHVACGDDHYYRKRPELVRRGSGVKQAKLTEEMVADIKSRDYSQRGSQVEVAQEFNVTPGSICMILKGITWKHVG